MTLSPDGVEIFRFGWLSLNATIVSTWFVMLIMVVGARLATRGLRGGVALPRWQNLLETLLEGIRQQIREVSGQRSEPFLPFIGTLFIFIAVANFLAILPTLTLTMSSGETSTIGYLAPTGSLSTTAALAMCVFIAVPIFGVSSKGLRGYLQNYVTPSVVMLPFNIVGEISRTLALAVRLFGNVMSGSLIAAVLISIVPFIFPTVMQALGLLTGLIQAYIFAILAMVYVASATEQTSVSQDADRG